MKREFPCSIVLSVVGGKLLCEFSGVHELIEYLACGSVWTHQIPRPHEPLKAELLRQFPELRDYNDEDVTSENYKEKLAEAEECYGKTFLVAPIAEPENLWRDPIAEAVDMVGEERVVVLPIPPDIDYPEDKE